MRKKTFNSGFTCSEVISLTFKKCNFFVYTYTFKINTGKLSAKMDMDKKACFPTVNYMSSNDTKLYNC